MNAGGLLFQGIRTCGRIGLERIIWHASVVEIVVFILSAEIAIIFSVALTNSYGH